MSSTSPSVFNQIPRPANLEYLGRDPVAVNQIQWFIDPVNGLDNQTGLTAATALKTFAELARRWSLAGGSILPGGFSALVAPIQLITVNILSSLPITDPVDLDIRLPPNTLLAFVGTPTTVRTGTLTTAIAQDRNNNIPTQIADAVTPFTAADVGLRVRATSGPALDAFAWIVKDQGAGVMRTTRWANVTNPPPADRLILLGLTVTDPTIGTNYVVETLPQIFVRGGNVTTPLAGSSVNSMMGFSNLEFRAFTTGGNIVEIRGTYLPNYKGCKFAGGVLRTSTTNPARDTFLNCLFAGPGPATLIVLPNSNVLARAGGALGTVSLQQSGVGTVFDNDFLVQGGFGLINTSYLAQLALLGIFDSLDAGVFGGATFINQANFGGTHLIWGAGNAGAGIAMSGGTNLIYQANIPTITGSIPGTNDFTLGGAATSRAWNEAGSVYTALLTNSWTNLGAAIGVGGFGGNAHNVERSSNIVMG